MRKLNRREFIASSAALSGYLLSNQAIAQTGDLTGLSIADASRLIRSHEITPIELAQAYLSRIERYDSQLNTYITITDSEALAQAETLQQELQNGGWRGPLHGIPIALKDNIDTAGILTTGGSAVYGDRIPEEDAEVVTRLKNAGAIILGKLNLHEFAYGATSSVTGFGSVRNPWAVDRIPGGSSGGSGAAVAAQLCAGALGTDTGGSIRIPAAHCGITGLKPTYGLASIRGIIPLSVSLDHVGPMCRSVEDVALMLQPMVGYDPRGIASIRADIPDYAGALNRPTSKLRLGIPREYYEDLESGIGEAANDAITVLRELTASTQEIQLPTLPVVNPVFVEAYAYHAELLETRRELYDPITLTSILNGLNIPANVYTEALYELKLLRKAVESVFDEVDLLITPTLARLPVTIESALDPNSQATTDLIRNPMPFNIYGIPTISIPCGFSPGGMPIGLQISGPALGEVDVLSLAHAFQQVTDWHKARPTLG